MTSNRLEYIDSLRCVAAAAVLGQHLLESANATRFHGFLELAPGVFGVVVFFYLSGLVIPISVRRNPTLPSFLLRRVFRIFPAYWFVLAMLAVLSVLGVQPWTRTFAEAGLLGTLANVLLIQEYTRQPSLLGVSWTLALEFVWYGLFSLLFYYLREKHLARIATVYGAALILLSTFSMMGDFRVPAGRLGMLGAALLGYLVSKWQMREIGNRQFAIAVTTFVSALMYSQVVAFGYFTHPSISLFNGLAGWFSASLLFFGVTTSGWLRNSRLLRIPWVVFLGKISYSVYLVHGPILTVLKPVLPEAALLATVPILTVVTAWFSFNWIERPGVTVGRALERTALLRAKSWARAPR